MTKAKIYCLLLLLAFAVGACVLDFSRKHRIIEVPYSAFQQCGKELVGINMYQDPDTHEYVLCEEQQEDSPISETKRIVWEKLVFNPTLSHQPFQTFLPFTVGVIKNEFGTEAAYAWIIPEPKEWLAEAIKFEFNNVGLEVGNENAHDPRVSIIVDQFFVEVLSTSLTAVTILDVRITLPKQGKIFQRRFVGEWSRVTVKFSIMDYALLRSAQLAFHEAAQETRKLIDREER